MRLPYFTVKLAVLSVGNRHVLRVCSTAGANRFGNRYHQSILNRSNESQIQQKIGSSGAMQWLTLRHSGLETAREVRSRGQHEVRWARPPD